MLKRKDIRVRDPFIVLEDGVYYLYATTGETTLSVFTSKDLENWEPGGTAFEIPAEFWAIRDVWAAEVHKYREKFRSISDKLKECIQLCAESIQYNYTSDQFLTKM